MDSIAAKEFLRRRLIFRAVTFGAAVIVVTSIVVAQSRKFDLPLDDWFAFNHRQFRVTGVVSGNLIQIQTDAGLMAQVALTGVVLSPGHQDRMARDYLCKRILSKPVTLLLETPQTRNQDGQLLAYVFPSDGDNLNVDIVTQGLARADPAGKSPLALQLQSAEYTAHKGGHGIWLGSAMASSKKSSKKASHP